MFEHLVPECILEIKRSEVKQSSCRFLPPLLLTHSCCCCFNIVWPREHTHTYIYLLYIHICLMSLSWIIQTVFGGSRLWRRCGANKSLIRVCQLNCDRLTDALIGTSSFFVPFITSWVWSVRYTLERLKALLLLFFLSPGRCEGLTWRIFSF